MENPLLNDKAPEKKGGFKKKTEDPKAESVTTAQEAESEIKIDENKVYTFELLPEFARSKHYGLANVSEVFDVKSGRRRKMRYVPHYDSIWLDEQPTDPIEMSDYQIRFWMGKKQVTGKDKMMILFLLNHDRIEGNLNPISSRGPVFKISDQDAFAKKQIQSTIIERDAIDKALSLQGEELTMISYVLFGRPFDTESQALQAVINFAKQKPQSLLSVCDDPRTKRKFLIKKGFDSNILKEKFSMLKWGASDADIVQLPPDREVLSFLTDWSLSDDGKDFFEILKRQLA